MMFHLESRSRRIWPRLAEDLVHDLGRDLVTRGNTRSWQLVGGLPLAMLVLYLAAVSATPLRAQSVSAELPPLPVDRLPESPAVDQIQRRIGQLGGHVPEDNPLTEEKVALGRRLFFDPLLSKDRTVSCATCHDPAHGFASAAPRAVGIRGQLGPRNSPTVLNRAVGKSQFWDGRAGSLEIQSLQPIENPLEMNHKLPAVLDALRRAPEYAAAFESAFGDSDAEQDPITAENLGKALASFQRTLLLDESPVDAFQAGDYSALTKTERQGLWIFESRGGCWQCHRGPNYSDEQFHNLGIGYGERNRDVGRAAVTKRIQDTGKFKTPTLRGVAQTAPYMHDGRLKTLEDVVEFYNAGGDPADPQIDPRIRPLGLADEEIEQLVAFLRALSPRAGNATSDRGTERADTRDP